MKNLLPVLVLVSGCGAQDPSMMMQPAADTTPHMDFASDTYTLQPGDEKYFCYTANLPADQDIVITKFVPNYGAATHHILFSQTIGKEQEGFHECPVLSKQTWLPLYAAGRDSGPLSYPEGVAVKPLSKGQQLVMQLHLQNASAQPISAKTSMRIEYRDASLPFIPAGIYGIDDHALDIPAHATNAASLITCKPNYDMNVFAVLGHMHKHGKHLQLSRGATAGAEMLFDEQWNFDLQPISPKAFKVAKGEPLYLQCEHENPTDAAIKYGESSDTEMCASILYYAPAASPLGGCVQ